MDRESDRRSDRKSDRKSDHEPELEKNQNELIWFDKTKKETNNFENYWLLQPIRRGIYPNSLTCPDCGICCYSCSC
jgi:hypothetical protein